ncbi:hypothetical protein HY642_02700 [Candidatus Woesearchaeota archaeon]|nr:hypothetical protein [Candidatus Woesearchaeota archaeon]
MAKDAICEEGTAIDEVVRKATPRLFRIDQTTVGIRVTAGCNGELEPKNDVVYEKAILPTFGQLYNYFRHHYRDTAYGAKLEMHGLVPKEEILLKIQWYGGRP